MTPSRTNNTDATDTPSKIEILKPPFNPSWILTFFLFLLSIIVTSCTYQQVNDAYLDHVNKTLGVTQKFTLNGQPEWTQHISRICQTPIPGGLFVDDYDHYQSVSPQNSTTGIENLGHGACVVDRLRTRLGLTSNIRGVVDGSEDLKCAADIPKQRATNSATRWAALCGNIAYLTKMHKEKDIWLLRHPEIKGKDKLDRGDIFRERPDTARSGPDPCGPANGVAYLWFDKQCLFERLTGIKSDRHALFNVHKPAPEASPRGVVYDWNDAGVRPSDNIDHRRQLSVLRAFDKAIETSWDSILNDEEIKTWRLIIRVLNGYPQYLIVLVGVFATFLLFARLVIAGQQRRDIKGGKGTLYESFKKHCQKVAAENGERVSSNTKLAVEETFNRFLSTGSSTTVDWLISIIPLLGFVGTVYGMILALGTINTVVSAEPGPELDSAMSQIGGDLSLAFTTTLLALLFTIYLIFLREAVRSTEMKLVATLPAINEGAK